jgi:hypothetical protein
MRYPLLSFAAPINAWLAGLAASITIWWHRRTATITAAMLHGLRRMTSAAFRIQPR